MPIAGLRRKRIISVVLFTCLLAFSFMGCSEEKESEKGKDWDYTVVPMADCPADFLSEINKKKMNAFQMTYDDGAYCYLAVGYGEQEKNGFSIKVLGLYEKGESLCLETSLVGPEEDQIVSNKKSTPFIVVKTQRTEKKIEFL